MTLYDILKLKEKMNLQDKKDCEKAVNRLINYPSANLIKDYDVYGIDFIEANKLLDKLIERYKNE